jgi:hypothetical protein
MLLVFEAFVLSAGQDLIFFGLWNRGVFPLGDWTWMPFYTVFGAWTTMAQFLFTASLTLASCLICKWKEPEK